MRILILETNAKTKEDLLYEISVFAEKNKITTSSNLLLKAFVDREKEFSTGFENGIAIPHARIKQIKESAIIIARNKSGVDWKSLDGQPTDSVIALAIQGGETADDEHLETLATVSSLLITPENIQVFKKGSVDQINKLINDKIAADKAPKVAPKDEDYYDFIGVTSCPTGVAHTNMAAEALERYAKEHGLKAKIERQAAQGIVNPISMEDVAKAHFVIIAIGRQIEGYERFDGKKLIEVGVSAPIKDSGALWRQVQDAPIYNSPIKPGGGAAVKVEKTSGVKGKKNKAGHVSLMQSVMTGLSYMIPIVIVGGIFLAFGLGIGRIAVGGDVSSAANIGTFWNTIFQIGVVGINLSVLVLGGFIAQAIGGRLALAPAFIISAACQSVGIAGGRGGENPIFWNYAEGRFGVPTSNLSFFGAIAAAFLIGFAAKYWTQFVSPRIPKAVKTVEPIIIVPILFVLVGWVLFAFILYLPLYYLSYGLNKAVVALVDNNLLWIAGAVGGAMLCFDLGGPVNKIAFGTGVLFLGSTNFHPEVMGAFAAAGSVAPVGQATGYLIGAKVFKIQKLREDEMLKDSVIPAYFMGLVGISEGAIPFTIRNPKTAIVSNLLGGALAGAISGAFLITDVAAHTGPIVWILGAVGRNGVTDYVYGLLYIMAWAAGSVLTAFLFVALELFFDRRAKKLAGVQVEKISLKLKREKTPAQAAKIVENYEKDIEKVETYNKAWKGYAWKNLTKKNSNK